MKIASQNLYYLEARQISKSSYDSSHIFSLVNQNVNYDGQRGARRFWLPVIMRRERWSAIVRCFGRDVWCNDPIALEYLPIPSYHWLLDDRAKINPTQLLDSRFWELPDARAIGWAGAFSPLSSFILYHVIWCADMRWDWILCLEFEFGVGRQCYYCLYVPLLVDNKESNNNTNNIMQWASGSFVLCPFRYWKFSSHQRPVIANRIAVGSKERAR